MITIITQRWLDLQMNVTELTPVAKAGILPYFNNGKNTWILFMQPSNPEYGGSAFQIAKGGIDPGEDELTAALREGSEGLGLRSDNIKHTTKVMSSTITGLDETYNLTVFLAQIIDPDAFDTPHYETARSAWLSQAEYARYGRSSQQSIVNKAFSMLK